MNFDALFDGDPLVVFSALLASVIGGFVGALSQAILPRLLHGPRLRIIGIDHHRSYNSYNFVVVNKGRTAAINAMGRITIRPIDQDSITKNSEGIIKATTQIAEDSRKHTDWRRSGDAWLSPEDWEIGIEAEHVYWATYPNPRKLNINPGVPERVAIAHSKGQWVDIASESFARKRTQLALKTGQSYYGALVVVAENCKPSKPFRFRISLGHDGRAIIEPFKGVLPQRT